MPKTLKNKVGGVLLEAQDPLSLAHARGVGTVDGRRVGAAGGFTGEADAARRSGGHRPRLGTGAGLKGSAAQRAPYDSKEPETVVLNLMADELLAH